MIFLFLDYFEAAGLGQMSVSPARDWALQHNLSAANQIGGLLTEIEFNPEWISGILCESRTNKKECCRNPQKGPHILFNPPQIEKSQRLRMHSAGERRLLACYRRPARTLGNLAETNFISLFGEAFADKLSATTPKGFGVLPGMRRRSAIPQEDCG